MTAANIRSSNEPPAQVNANGIGAIVHLARARMLPLIAIMAMTTAAGAQPPEQEQSFGHWHTHIVLNGASMQSGSAYTENGPDTGFGVACGRLCTFYLVPPIPCVEGTEYKVLAANRTDADEIRLRCVHSDVGDGLTADYGARIEALLTGDTISFAFPLDKGQFNISRFSLNGAKQAIAAVVGRWQQQGGPIHAPDDDSKVPDQKLNDTTL